jgi:hypothetical protein
LLDCSTARSRSSSSVESWLAALHQVHHLADDQLESIRIVRRQCREHRLHPWHVAVVIGAPHVDQVLEAAVHLVAVEGDIGEEVGRQP